MSVSLLVPPAWPISGHISSKFFSQWYLPFPSQLPDLVTSIDYEWGDLRWLSPGGVSRTTHKKTRVCRVRKV